MPTVFSLWLQYYLPNIKFTIVTIFVCTTQRRYVPVQPLAISRTFASSPSELLYPLHSSSSPTHPPRPRHSLWSPPFYFLSLWIWQFFAPHINGIMQHLSFCVWFISLLLTFVEPGLSCPKACVARMLVSVLLNLSCCGHLCLWLDPSSCRSWLKWCCHKRAPSPAILS